MNRLGIKMKEVERMIRAESCKDVRKFIELYVLSIAVELKLKYSDEDKRARESKLIFGDDSDKGDVFFVERDRIVNLLKKDGVQEDVIESVRDFYEISGRTVFQIDSKDEESLINEGELEQEISFGEKIRNLLSTEEGALGFSSGKLNIDSLGLSKPLADWLAVLRTKVLMRIADQSLESRGLIDSSLVDLGAYLFFKADNAFYGRSPFFDPNVASGLVDWVANSAGKDVVVVLDGPLMAQFLAYAYCLVGKVFVINRTTNIRERLFLELCKSISMKFDERTGQGKVIVDAEEIPVGASIITQDANLKNDLDSKAHFKDCEASRMLVVADSDINKWMGVQKGVELSEIEREKVCALANARSIVRVKAVPSSKQYNLFLYDARYDLPICGFTDLTKIEGPDVEGASEGGVAVSDLYLTFKKIISSPFIAEQYLSNEMQFLFLMDSQRAQEIWRAKGYRFPGLKREVLFSSIPASSGALEKYVTIKRGQVLAKASEGVVGFEINPGDINDAGLIDNPKKFVTHLDAEKNEKYRIKKGDILIGVKGMVGVVAYIDKDVENWYAGQAVAILRKKETKDKVDDSFISELVTSEFIFLCLKSSFSQSILQSSLAGRSKSIDMDKLRNFLLSCPEYSPAVYAKQCDELFLSWREFQKRKLLLNHIEAYSSFFFEHVFNTTN